MAIAAISILYLILSKHFATNEAKCAVYEPVIFNADQNFTFEKTVEIFENLTDEANRLSISNDAHFFRFFKIFKLRTVLYRTGDFVKKEFESAKKRVNKLANYKFEISSWVSRDEARKMMRFYVIYTDALSDELYRFISGNTCHNLSRAEGVINIVIVENQVILPPIYGECDLMEISRYKGVIKFINQVFLKHSA